MSEGGSEGIYLGIPGIDSIDEIGRSASHTTYRVRDIATGQSVVIKLLNAGRDWPGLPERFEREQAAMAALGHPNIVVVLGHGWSETGMPYIVTGEIAGGSSIGDRLRGPTPMTGPDILSLGVRLAGALESAHRAGVVHGDLRPDDMMISPQGEPLLADFGVVTLVRPNAADVTDPADLAHVAPELLDGEPASAGSDLYSLTSALYTLFAGLPAYVRPGEQSIIPVIKRIASDPLPDLGAKNVPAPVVDAITKAMAKDPAERYQTAQDLGRSLQQAQVALGLPMTEMTMLGAPPARTAPARRVTPAAAIPPPPTTATAPTTSATPPANRTPLVVAAIAVVLVIAAIAFFATRDSGSKVVVSPTTTTTRATTTTGPETTDTTLPPAGASTELLTNDGGQLEVNVPTSWTDRRTAANPNGTPELQASTDIAEFQGTTFLQPGIDFAVFAPDTIDPSDLDAALDRLVTLDRQGSTLDTLCTRGTRDDFTPNGTGLAAGRVESLTGCNGGGDIIIVAATNADLTFTLLMEVHFGNPPDDAGVDAVTSSFNVVKFP
ncbi:MAG: hypothetical protein QOD92_2952 [Acidimicrobiaceae bacterium]